MLQLSHVELVVLQTRPLSILVARFGHGAASVMLRITYSHN